MFGRLRLIDWSVPLEDRAGHEPLPARINDVTHDGVGLRQMLSVALVPDNTEKTP